MDTSSRRLRGSGLRMKSGLSVVLVFIVACSSNWAAEAKVKRIDTHAHFVPTFYADLLNAKGLTAGGLAIPKWDADAHLAFMDSLNIQLSILSASTPGARFSESDVEEGRTLARQLNEYGHMLAVKYPERFQFFATLTLPDVEGSIAEAIYALDTLKAAGVVLMANIHGEYLGSRNFDPLMEVLNEREAVVFVHPSHLDIEPVTNDLGDGKKVKISPNVIDFLLDTTRAAENLVVMTVTKRYPNIKFLLAHSGGFLPFAAYRMAGALSEMMGEKSPQPFLKELQKFYVDIALSTSPSALPSTFATVPHDQISFGSDYPYAPSVGITRATHMFEKYPLEDEKRETINYHCANGLFEKPLSHWRKVWHKEELHTEL